MFNLDQEVSARGTESGAPAPPVMPVPHQAEKAVGGLKGSGLAGRSQGPHVAGNHRLAFTDPGAQVVESDAFLAGDSHENQKLGQGQAGRAILCKADGLDDPDRCYPARRTIFSAPIGVQDRV